MDFLPSLCLSTGSSHILGRDAAHAGPCWSRYHIAAHGEPHAAADECALKDAVACGKSMQKQAPLWNCGLWRGANAREDFVARTVACRGSRLQQAFPEGLWEEAHTGAGEQCEEEAQQRKCVMA